MVSNRKTQFSVGSILKLNFWLIVLSLTLLRLPIALGYRTDLNYLYLGIIPYIWGILVNVAFLKHNNSKIPVNKRFLLLVSLFFVIWLVAFLRSAFRDFSYGTFYILSLVVTLAIFGIFLFLAFRIGALQSRISELKKAVVLSLGFYVMSNLIFFLVGIIPPDTIYLTDFPAQILSMIGIKTHRVLFPMTSGINYYGSLVGVTLLGLSLILKIAVSRFEKLVIILMILSCFISLFLVDSRGAIIITCISILMAILPWKVFLIARWFPFFLSTIIVVAFTFIPGFLEDPMSKLNRPELEMKTENSSTAESDCNLFNKNTSGVLSNRPIIWKAGFDELSNFKPIHLIGYGFRGQVASGVSRNYVCLFTSIVISEFASLHNIWLQTIIDVGYLGLIITITLLISLLVWVCQRLSTRFNHYDYALLCMMLMIISIGTLEASFQPDFQELFIFLFFLLISQVYVDQPHKQINSILEIN